MSAGSSRLERPNSWVGNAALSTCFSHLAGSAHGGSGRFPGGTPPQLDAESARVLYTRHGFDEWYENKKEGLEQGYTVHTPPSGTGWLCVEGRLGGDLHAEAREEGAVDFLDEHGACVLRYGQLKVWDAAGHMLASRLVVQGEELTIQVEDGGALYPLIIDPLLTSPAWTAEGDQNNAYFGYSVGTAGDVNGDGYSDVIVGAYFYVRHRRSRSGCAG
jgi:FG-GAP repeat